MNFDFEDARKSIDLYISLPEKTEESNEKIVLLLEELKSLELTKDILIKSKIGVSINKLRKMELEMIQKPATDLLFKWKDLMMPAKRKIEEVEDTKEEEKVDDADKKSVCSEVEGSTKEETICTKEKGSSNLKDYFIGDSVRDKCLEMLVTALMADQADGQNPDELIINTAQSIEKSLFNEFKTISPAYKSKFRSKYLNLKDKNNPTLRSGLISGMITPDRFISMSSAEMASEDRRRVDSMIAEQNMLNSQMAKDNAAETDQFKCGRCNQRKCKYYQMQTRSADEPMTTFVTCVNCGNRWRFC